MSEKTLLSYFWDLAATNEKIRIDAAVNLIEYLKSAKNTGEILNEVGYILVDNLTLYILYYSLSCVTVFTIYE